MPSSKMTMFSHILHESLSKFKALHLACWQAVTFQLPQAQQETAGWWAPPLTIAELQVKDYMPLATSSNL